MEAYLDASTLRELVAALEEAATQANAHEGGVSVLAEFFGTHFPVLCEVIAETVRISRHQKLHYWCDVAEMSEFANYHFTLD